MLKIKTLIEQKNSIKRIKKLKPAFRDHFIFNSKGKLNKVFPKKKLVKKIIPQKTLLRIKTKAIPIKTVVTIVPDENNPLKK